MREYIRKGVPKDVYIQVKGKLMGYDRLRRERMELLQSLGGASDGMPRGGMGNPTEQKAIKLEAINRELEAINQSCMEIRGEYSGKVSLEFDPLRAYWSYDYFNVQHVRKSIHDEGPRQRTWHRFKDMFTEKVAKKLNLI